MKKLKVFKPLWNLIKEEKSKILIAALFIFIVEFTYMCTGYLTGYAIEAITDLRVKESLIAFLIYLVITIVNDCFLYSNANAILEKAESKISRKLSFETYKKSLKLPAVAFEKTSSGEIINRITNDADSLSFTFGRLLKLFFIVLCSIFVIIFIFINSWIIALEIIIFLIIMFFIIRAYNPKLIKIHKERKNHQDNFSSIVNESIRGIREIKTLGIKKNLLNDCSLIIKDILNKSSEEVDVNKKFEVLKSLVKAFLESGVFITCVILLYYDQISLTFLISMTMYVYRFMFLIENINDFTKTYQKLYVSLERVNDILTNVLYKDETFGDKSISNIKGYINFNNVKFGYPEEDIILNDFNLQIEPNKKVAIVGHSGQGKSTLFNLLTRIFNPLEGNITLDNIDISELSEKDLRTNISIIRQEPFIFNRSILDNFKLLDKNLTLEEVRKYTKMAYLDDYIMSLPKGYDTILGEGGVNLSGGQKQRLSIARTLAKKSQVILFDEATSALDNNSQDYIKKSIDNLVKDHTVIIVAHRLSTIIDADIIHVVDKGRVIASGNHDYLLKTNEIYKNLYTTESLNS